MRRTRALSYAALTTLAALPLLAPAAAASPTAEALDAGEVNLAIPTADGGYDVELLAGSSGGQVLLDVLAARHGQPLQRYGGQLAPSAFSADVMQATLRTELGGQPLTVRWRTHNGFGSGVAIALGRADGEGSDTQGWHAVGQLVDVTVQLGASTCTGTGLLGKAVAYRTADDARHLSALPAVDPSGGCRFPT